jgi:hypothetical protein
MNRMLALFAVGLACTACAGTASGQGDTQATFRMSWGTCEPQFANTFFTGPTGYNLVLSAADLTPGPTADDHLGTDVQLVVEPGAADGFPDAWRFDELGCQPVDAVTLSNAPLNPVCPAMTGPRPLAITYIYPLDEATNSMRIRLAIVYDDVSPAPNTRYTIWQVTFDMAKAVAGPGTPGVTCGGADRQMRIRCDFAQLATIRGVLASFRTAPGDLDYVTWNMGAPVRTEPATWGRLKGLYR